jgi:hypothetical protein
MVLQRNANLAPGPGAVKESYPVRKALNVNVFSAGHCPAIAMLRIRHPRRGVLYHNISLPPITPAPPAAPPHLSHPTTDAGQLPHTRAAGAPVLAQLANRRTANTAAFRTATLRLFEHWIRLARATRTPACMGWATAFGWRRYVDERSPGQPRGAMAGGPQSAPVQYGPHPPGKLFDVLKRRNRVAIQLIGSQQQELRLCQDRGKRIRQIVSQRAESGLEVLAHSVTDR